MKGRRRKVSRIIVVLYSLSSLAACGKSLGIQINEIENLGSKYSSLRNDQRKYVLANINRKDIAKTIVDWQNHNSVNILREPLLEIVVNYLKTEHYYLGGGDVRDPERGERKKGGLVGLKHYLNDVNSGLGLFDMKVYFGWEIGIGFMAFPGGNEYGRLKVQSVPSEAEIHIDGRFAGYTDTEFIITVGNHSILMVKPREYEECSRSINIEGGKKHAIKCELSANKK